MRGALSPLDRKLVRDLWRMRGQVGAIVLVVLCGIAQFVTTGASYNALKTAQAEYYSSHRFADLFVQVKRAPKSLRATISAIPGVQEAETRIVFPVVVNAPGLDEPAGGRIISIPEDHQPDLNRLYIRRGRYLERGRPDEILVSEAFAQANMLNPGDAIEAVIAGRWKRLRIAGIALSPEYIYEIRPGDLFPDNRRFGILWMGQRSVEAAFDMEGAFNDVVLSLAPGAIAEDVIADVDREFEGYGGLGAYSRDDQVSHRFITDEIAQNRVSAVVTPTIFLGVAAFLIGTVLTRLVGIERDQIGLLKAFGYGNAAIAVHYVKFAVVTVAIGSALGTLVGTRWGQQVGDLYALYYRFPHIEFRLRTEVLLLALAASALTAVAGATGAALKAAHLPPAEAMRPEAPASYQRGLLERLGVARLLSFSGRMIARDLARRPLRAVMSTVGIALAVALLVIGYFFVGAIRRLADVQFRHVQRDDITVFFREPLPGRALFEIRQLDGVLQAEPFRAVPVRIRHDHHSRRVALTSVEERPELRRVLNSQLSLVDIPPTGVVLTSKLAEVLNVVPGDNVGIDFLEGKRQTVAIRVAALVDEPFGLNAYVYRPELNRLLGEDGSLSGAYISIDPNAETQLYKSFKSMPSVAGASLRRVALESFEGTLARNIHFMTVILITFAGAIAFATVYNASRVALSERGRELASLRVLGFTTGEISAMLLGQQAILVIAAVPLGLLLGYGVCVLFTSLYSWELFRIPLVVDRANYLFSVLAVLASAVVSALIVHRRLIRLDLVAVIKTRE